ncbi:MAG: EpsG family protein [Endomicrobiia bacterium]
MIYFIVIYIAIIILSFTDFTSKFNKFGTWACIILLSCLAGFRNLGGKDFLTYEQMYETKIFYSGIEKFYIVVNHLFSNLGVSYNVFLFILSFIAILLLISAYQKISYFPKLSLMLYLGTYFFYYNMILNRQMVAVALLLWVIYFWDKNKIYSLVLFLFGFLFHQSIIVILPFLFIFSFIKKGKFLLGFCLTIVLLVALFINPESIMNYIFSSEESIVADRLSGYIMKADGSNYSVELFEYIKLTVILCIIIPIWKKLFQNAKTSVWLFLYCIGAIFLLWSSKLEIMFRIFMYFDLSFTILIPAAIKIYLSKITLTKSQKNFCIVCIYAMVGIIALISILHRITNFDQGSFLDYKFYFIEYL